MHSGQIIDSRWILGDVSGEGVGSVCYFAEHKRIDRTGIVRILRPEFNGPDCGAAFNQAVMMHSMALIPELILTQDAGCADLGEQGITPYVVTAPVLGVSLDDSAVQNWSLRKRRGVALALADATARLHAVNKVHGDLKPSTVMVCDEGELPIQLLMVGWLPHRALGAMSDKTAISTATRYWSPELTNRGERSKPGDVFSLGRILLELLAGEAPAREVYERWPNRPNEIKRDTIGEIAGAHIGSDLLDLLRASQLKQPEWRPDVASLAGALNTLHA